MCLIHEKNFIEFCKKVTEYHNVQIRIDFLSGGEKFKISISRGKYFIQHMYNFQELFAYNMDYHIILVNYIKNMIEEINKKEKENG